MKLTIYDKYLIDTMADMFSDAPAATVVEELIRMGVVDSTRCKILLIREEVDALWAQGHSRTEAMYLAAKKYCCSIECVRKYVYYHKDINLPKKP